MTERASNSEGGVTSFVPGNLYYDIVENLNQGILILVKGRLVFLNRKMVSLTGFSKKALLSGSVVDFFHSGDVRSLLKAEELPQPAVVRILRKNRGFIRLKLFPRHVSWNGQTAILCHFTEIRESRNNGNGTASPQETSETDRFEITGPMVYDSGDTYRKILNHIQDGYFEVNLAGNLLFFNKVLCEISGYPPGKLQNIHYKDYTSPHTAKSLFRVFNSVYKTGNACKIKDFELIQKNGSIRNVSISVSLIRTHSGKPVGYRGIVRDITSRKKVAKHLEKTRTDLEKRVEERTSELVAANKELMKAKEAADQSARAKTEFLANMSHEIRTPLNAIIGMADLLMKAEDPDKQQDYLKIIRSSSLSLLDLLNDILDFSRIESGSADFKEIQFNLQDVVDNLADMFLEKNITKRLELIVDIKPNVPDIIYGDPLRLRQILANLLSNAFKFTEKGEILISAETRSIENDRLELQLSVKDTGIGIATQLFRDNNRNIFDAFAQADSSSTRKYGGTGIGLAICQKIVTLMGGDIWVESTPGKGSTFFFTCIFKHNPGTGFKKLKVPAAVKNKRALLVEDNPSTLMVIKRYLNSFGFRTDICQTAEEALVFMENTIPHEPVGLVLMDVHLPGMDGITAARAIKQKYRDTAPPVIIISAIKQEMDTDTSRMSGVEGFLMKPVKPSLLFDTIMNIFGHEKPTKPLPPPDTLANLHLLLVEDNTINQMVVMEMLAIPGITLDVANNGLDAVNCLRNKAYDAVLMDIQMPEMDGLEATKAIREELGLTKLPIIAMTAHAMYGDREKCLAAGMTDYISKPLDRERLLHLLKINVRRPIRQNSTANLPDLPGIDIHEGLMRFDGSWSRYAKILVSFKTGFMDFTIKIKTLIETRCYDEAIIKAHSLKGTAGNISAKDLFIKAESLEKALRNEQENGIAKHLMAVDYELEKVLDAIGTISSPKVKAAETVRARDFSPEKALGLIPDLLKSLSESDPVDSEIKLSEIKRFICNETQNNRYDGLISDLEAHIEHYNFDEAIDVLKSLNRQLEDI